MADAEIETAGTGLGFTEYSYAGARRQNALIYDLPPLSVSVLVPRL